MRSFITGHFLPSIWENGHKFYHPSAKKAACFIYFHTILEIKSQKGSLKPNLTRRDVSLFPTPAAFIPFFLDHPTYSGALQYPKSNLLYRLYRRILLTSQLHVNSTRKGRSKFKSEKQFACYEKTKQDRKKQLRSLVTWKK